LDYFWFRPLHFGYTFTARISKSKVHVHGLKKGRSTRNKNLSQDNLKKGSANRAPLPQVVIPPSLVSYSPGEMGPSLPSYTHVKFFLASLWDSARRFSGFVIRDSWRKFFGGGSAKISASKIFGSVNFGFLWVGCFHYYAKEACLWNRRFPIEMMYTCSIREELRPSYHRANLDRPLLVARGVEMAALTGRRQEDIHGPTPHIGHGQSR
jgi:hypothetical protein